MSDSDVSDGNPDVSTNTVSGTIFGPTVQAGSIHGGVHIHHVAPLVTVPHQLPAVQECFTNRRHELDELTRATQRKPGRRPLTVITGTGGVGKTALAVWWSSRQAEYFRDGMLYADLGAFDPAGPVSPNDVLGEFLRGLGVPPEAIPVRSAERSAMFRSISHDKLLLVLLDNAASATQVRPLLPASANSVVLVTARSKMEPLIVDGAWFLDLHPLDSVAALDLIQKALMPRRVSAEVSAAAQLARFCGGLPLALWVMLARLAAHPRLSIGKVVKELSDENNRLGALSSREELSVEVVFDLSYRALPADSARLYRLLGLHPGPDLGTDAAAALAGSTSADAVELLAVLVEANLLEEVDDGRFDFHDLLRLHARQHADQEETADDRASATDRLLDYYTFWANQADRLINLLDGRPNTVEHAPENAPGLESHAMAVNWMETERRNLLASIQLAIDTGRPRQAVRLAMATIYFLKLKGYWAEELGLCQRIATVCEAIGDREGLADTEFYRGDIYRLTGALSEAQDWYERALASYQSLEDGYREARTQHSIGDIKRAGGLDTDALERYEAAQAIYRDLSNHLAEARALHSIADTHRTFGRHDDALANYQQLLNTYRELDDSVGQARVVHSMGDIVRLAGEHEEALRSCERALDAYRELGDRLGEADALSSLGDIFADLGQRGAAVTHYDDALTIYRSLGNRRNAEDVLRRLEEIRESPD